MNIDTLKFLYSKTNFSEAFNSAYKLLIKHNTMPTTLIFMTDGSSSYPTIEIAKIKEYLALEKYKKTGFKFTFFAIGFQIGLGVIDFIVNGFKSGKEVLRELANDLEGSLRLTLNEKELKSAYREILNKNDV